MNGGEYYRKTTTFAKRYNLSDRMKQRYPRKVPILAYPLNEPNDRIVNNTRFIVERDDIIAKFLRLLKEQVKSNIDPDAYSSIFLFIERHFIDSEGKSHYDMIVPLHSFTIGDVYQKYSHPDGFLYVYYGKENIFGEGNQGSPSTPPLRRFSQKLKFSE